MAAPAFINLVPGEQLVLYCNIANSGLIARGIVNTSRGITLTTNTSTDEQVDANNPGNAAQVIRSVKSLDSKIDGAGTFDANSAVAFQQWWANGAVVSPCQFVVNSPGGTANAVTYTGNYILTQFQITGTRAEKTKATITLEQAAMPTVTLS